LFGREASPFKPFAGFTRVACLRAPKRGDGLQTEKQFFEADIPY
jgi:hypothetical protein